MNYADSVATEVVAKLVETLENGINGNWVRPWKNVAGDLPMNASTGKEYQGWNIFNLWIASAAKGYSSNYWATFNQWKALGATIKKGSKREVICFWQVKKYEETKADGNTVDRTRPMFKIYNVFNADCVTGWTQPAIEQNEFNINEQCANTVAGTGAKIVHNGNRACFIPSMDQINMPIPESFKSPELYYATAFHELVHWTGAKSRLNREFGKRFGDEAYGFEELVAELGSAILCAKHGIESQTMDDHAKYLKSWIKTLKTDPKALFTAGSNASKAVSFIVEASAEEIKQNIAA